MVRDTSNKIKRRKIRFLGIVSAADALGVSRGHLWKVLAGQRTSDALLRRYQQWKKEAAHAE